MDRVQMNDILNNFESDVRDCMSTFCLIAAFEVIGEDGQTSQLQSSGVFSFRAEANGTEARVTEMQADVNKPGDDTYTMGADGTWQQAVPVSETSKRRRRKRQALNEDAPTLQLDWSVPYINSDKPLVRNRLCHTAVQTYKDADRKEPVPHQKVRIFMKENGNYVGQSETYTNDIGVACLITACGLEHELVVTDNDNQQMKAFQDQYVPSSVAYAGLENDYRLVFVSPSTDEVRTEAYSRGPVYPYNRYSYNSGCRSSNLVAYAFSFYVYPPPWPGALDYQNKWDSATGFFAPVSITYSYYWGRTYTYTYMYTPVCAVAVQYNVRIAHTKHHSQIHINPLLLITTHVVFNPFKPEFIIVIFIHYKPRIAVAILDL